MVSKINTDENHAIIAERRLGTIAVTGNIHDNNFVPIERVSDAVVGVDCPVCAPFKITPRGTDQGLLVF